MQLYATYAALILIALVKNYGTSLQCVVRSTRNNSLLPTAIPGEISKYAVMMFPQGMIAAGNLFTSS